VTTNFDDFLSQALILFGASHIVCHHPRTALRVEPERADRTADDPSSMRDFLERLLSPRSPFVVGYSGWENDVFMSALKRRMKEGLKFNLYWFCYKFDNSAEELAACDLDVKAGDKLTDLGASDGEVNAKVATALVDKGITLGQLNRSEEAAGVFKDVVGRYAGDSAPGVQAVVERTGAQEAGTEPRRCPRWSEAGTKVLALTPVSSVLAFHRGFP
jgi:hypothetical protein